MTEPSRPPDTRRDIGLPTRGQRRLQSADASAYALANRLFNLLLPYFGQKTQMPMIYWRGRDPGGTVRRPGVGGAATGNFEDPIRTVVFPHGSRYAMDEPGTKQTWIDILLHELAHTQQGPLVWDESNPRQRHINVEGGADAFAKATRARIGRALGIGPPVHPYWGYPHGEGADFLSEYGLPFVLHGQFSRRPRR